MRNGTYEPTLERRDSPQISATSPCAQYTPRWSGASFGGFIFNGVGASPFST